MSHPNFDPDRVVRLLLIDADGLGELARAEVGRLATTYAELAYEHMQPPDPDAVEEAQRFYDQAVVDNFQQTAHDLYWHTTWPPCPRHENHPLWYDVGQDAWCCPRDGTPLISLGGLASSRADV